MNPQETAVTPIKSAKDKKELNDAIAKIVADLEHCEGQQDKGRLRSTTRNLARIIENAPLCLGFSVHYDEFTADYVIGTPDGRLPLKKETVTAVIRMLTDHEYRPFAAGKLSMFMEMQEPDYTRLRDVLRMVGMNQPVDSLKECFLALPEWDGVPRVEKFFTHYVPCDNPPEYLRLCALYLFTGACARAFEPGVKMDSVVTLIGPQGTRKSTVKEALAFDEKWQASIMLSKGVDKETNRMRVGLQWLEWAELDRISDSKIEEIRDDLSKTHDQNRRMGVDYHDKLPRRFSSLGTANAERFLNDPAGNRRFFPVSVIAQCLIEEIKADRDQLYAEAMVYYRRDGMLPYWLAAEKLALVEHQRYLNTDPWEDKLREVVESNKYYRGVTNSDLNNELGIEGRYRDRKTQHRINTIMRSLGWRESTNVPKTCGGKGRGFLPPV